MQIYSINTSTETFSRMAGSQFPFNWLPKPDTEAFSYASSYLKLDTSEQRKSILQSSRSGIPDGVCKVKIHEMRNCCDNQ